MGNILFNIIFKIKREKNDRLFRGFRVFSPVSVISMQKAVFLSHVRMCNDVTALIKYLFRG